MLILAASEWQIRKNGVIDNLAVRRAKVYVGQAVHLVVVEGLLKVTEVVLPGLKITKFIVIVRQVLHIIQRNDAVNVVHLCGKYQESKDDYLQKIVHWFED